MARRQVYEVVCDRCSKVETQEILGKPEEPTEPAFTANLKGEKVVYQDMCRSCTKAVTNYFKSLTKQVEKAPKDEEKPASNPDPERRGILRIGRGAG